MQCVEIISLDKDAMMLLLFIQICTCLLIYCFWGMSEMNKLCKNFTVLYLILHAINQVEYKDYCVSSDFVNLF